MNKGPYSLDAWRRFKEGLSQNDGEPATHSLADIPADAEMDEGIVLGCWNGERFVSWEKWRATAPIEREPQPEAAAIPSDARCLKATCGTTRVWLVRDGDRWLMFAGTRSSRRRDFASPFLSHAQRTAEASYGPATKGWQVGAQE
jgi:hypothetical protein